MAGLKALLVFDVAGSPPNMDGLRVLPTLLFPNKDVLAGAALLLKGVEVDIVL